MDTLHVKKGDTVIVLSGKDKGKKGKVLEVSPTEKKVIVEGINQVTRHVKPRRQGDPGGIIKADGALYACKVMAICPKCGKPTRLGHKLLAPGERKNKSGKDIKKVRVCKNAACGAEY